MSEWQAVAGMAGTFGLLSVFSWMARRSRRMAGSGNRARLRLAARLDLTAQHAAHLIDADARALLVVTSPGGPPLVVAASGQADASRGLVWGVEECPSR